MPSALDVCNLALARIGSRTPLASLDEAAPEALYCKSFYDLAVDAALADNDWRFATVQAPLALAGTAPAPWAYQYALPADCIRPRGVMPSTGGGSGQPYVGLPGYSSPDTAPAVAFTRATGRDAQGNFIPVIWTNLAGASLLYTARIANPNAWEPMFVVVVSWRLAMEIAVPLTGNGALLSAMSQGYQAAITEAAATSANSGTMVDSHTPEWLAVRGMAPDSGSLPYMASGLVPTPTPAPMGITLQTFNVQGVNLSDLPTSSAGLTTGQLWNNGGVVCIVA